MKQLISLGASLILALVLAGCEEANTPDRPSKAEETSPKGSLELLFTYGSEKEKWIEAVTERFNNARNQSLTGKPIFVRGVPMGSGECIDGLLEGTTKAHLTSPASEAFIKIGNAESRARTGKDLIPETSQLVLSPVVIAIWKPMAEALGWPDKALGWAEILSLARSEEGWAAFGYPQWGRFKFGHTHPEYSNSGLISLLAEVYAATGKRSGLTLEDVANPAVAEFVRDIESSVVHYGSSTGFFGRKMFAAGPQFLSAAVLYENMVVESYGPKYAGKLPFPVVAIYPKEGTFWSDHPAGIVDREWVNEEHRDAAKQYLDFLLAEEQQQEALPFGFRPADPAIPVGAPIDAAHGVDPSQPKTVLEVPNADVMEAILRLWHDNKKRSKITLVIDTSGSMQEDGKINAAREGALQLLEILSDRDRFSLLPFNNHLSWALDDAPLGEQREKAAGQISSLYAQGGTALYDAIETAFNKQMETAADDRDKISAIVVLTDGADTNSKTQLRELLNEIRSDSENRNVRIFTIAYGSGAEGEILEQISEATQAKSYEGNPENIRTVFRDISTFF